MSSEIEAAATAALAAMGDSYGLEDFDVGQDQSIPRVQIAHAETQFEDKSSGILYEELDGVALGLVKQRTLWDAVMREDEGPLCKSLDAKDGTPGEKFPWTASGLEAVPEGETVSCADCALKDWGSHPTRDTPWCGEQWVIPFMADFPEASESTPVILTFKGSGIKPSKNFIAPFARAGKPLFASEVTIGLEARKNGSVRYAVPKFKAGKETSETFWGDYAANFLRIKEFLHTPRGSDGPIVAKTESSDDEELEF